MTAYRYPNAVGVEFPVSVSKGEVSGARMVTITAESAGIIPNGATADVWPSPTTMTVLTSAQQIEVVSTNGGDTVGGSGAWAVLLVGLDANYREIEETVNLAGLSPVVTTQAFLRVNDVTVVAAGSSGSNLGDLSLVSLITRDLEDVVEAGKNTKSSSHYTVPKDHSAVLRRVWLSVGKVDECKLTLYQRPAETGLWTWGATVNAYEATQSFDDLSVVFSEMTDIRFTCEALANLPNVAVVYQMYLFGDVNGN